MAKTVYFEACFETNLAISLTFLESFRFFSAFQSRAARFFHWLRTLRRRTRYFDRAAESALGETRKRSSRRARGARALTSTSWSVAAASSSTSLLLPQPITRSCPHRGITDVLGRTISEGNVTLLGEAVRSTCLALFNGRFGLVPSLSEARAWGAKAKGSSRRNADLGPQVRTL